MTYFEAFGRRIRLTGWRATSAMAGVLGTAVFLVTFLLRGLLA